ncbi:hypothetical protein A3A71_02065 [Candidatus Berkelbacteria bacterium RIFCSPLOWO2_01_FULL_50_28]|uniref:Alkyl hydroperoxide reductase subunit C/ Thiol specific antioxidant domain-containing protein n=1 Tax=Candidatus Berkelbacteria bacterium RIFCSPLOWO2_01_FULL_50_28 TaxID=1797471 RepID=A0A1F5EBL6_9BACT|nr:MAG: hypothetical protein A2807_00460 [Candidatus Berkelbacteria bacterium RIFCSPHIGHO2_01_FULL_50_36]OGD63223.1 MAG: hypothetical protein A3F39_02330 [Candidatus Berkelbacteria bacterium RIFCSPHIGHO2_12_FULL_50_11]OGD64809.1 MAG: hypothetical protein A3A71_02065 [Candidatus Berkelbacteria bacterium RIFCSPLOWO2_01_FULL_50_28]
MTARLVGPVAFLALVAVGFLMFGASDSTGNKQLTPAETIAPYATNVAIPNIQITDAAGKETWLNKLRGPILITLWSGECPECKEGLKDIETFVKGNTQFKVMLVNHLQNPETANAVLKKNSVTLPTYFDHNGDAFRALSATMPASYYIIEGRIRYFFPGRISTEHLQALLTQ